MFCNNCGKEVSDKAEICPQCGVRVKQTKEYPKNPGVAALLSFFITGLGQIYNGQITKGICLLIVNIILALIFSPLSLIGWAYGVYDAYTTARKINDRI